MSKYDKSRLIGQRFGRLLVTSEHNGASPSIRKYACVCDCGNKKHIAACSLIGGITMSCGCLHMDTVTRHGHSKSGKQSPTYGSWVAMISRCTNPSNVAYKYYGEVGITVCKSWRESFTAFLVDMGERPEGMTIDRVDGATIYSRATCRWATAVEQQENRSVTLRVEYLGDLVTLSRASALSGIKYVTLRGRYSRGLRGDALFCTDNLKRKP